MKTKTKKVCRNDELNKSLGKLFKGTEEYICVGKTKDGYFISGNSTKKHMKLAIKLITMQIFD